MPEDGAFPLRTRGDSTGPVESERHLARLIALGLTNAEIADRLGLSPGITAHRIARIFETLGCTKRRELAEWAAAHDLLDGV